MQVGAASLLVLSSWRSPWWMEGKQFALWPAVGTPFERWLSLVAVVQANFQLLLRSQLAFHVPGEIVQDGLPTTSLLLFRVRSLSVEHDRHGDPRSRFRELDQPDSVAENVLDDLVGNYLRVFAREIKTKGSVLGFHAR